MALEGSLTEVNLADIFQLLSLGGKTGCLTVTNRSDFGYIYFQSGRVAYASILNRPDRLGELLVRNEVITQEELSAAVESQAKEPGDRLGQILIRRGTLTEEQLSRFIAIQIEEAIYHLFSWSEGNFHFDPDQQPDEETFTVAINPENLLLEGARRVDEWSVIEKKIPSLDLIFAVDKDPTKEEGVELTSEQRRILPLLDGRRSVRDMVQDSGLVEFEVAKAIFGLLQAGYLHGVGQKEERPVASEGSRTQQYLSLGLAFSRAGMFEDAERELNRVLESDPEHPKARSSLAGICLKSGRYADALEHFAALPKDARASYSILRNLALALECVERFDEALAALTRAAKIRVDPGLLLARAVVLLKARRADESWSTFQEYRKQVGRETPPPLYYGFAVLAAAAVGRLEDALKLGREGLTHYPDSGPILVNTGVILELRGDLEAAEALFLKAVSGSGAPAQAHKNLGDLAYRRGDHAGARAHYERAVKLNDELGDDVYLKLGVIAYQETDREWAQRFWQRALELNPRNEVVRTNLELLGAASG
jgi:tetratricopeptide (TPR) repeat protein